MALIKKPVTGMRDIMPDEMEIRDYCISVIQKTYAQFGFTHIETPCMENLANLTSKQGGENEKLIFKVMKRGEKLRIADAKSENDLADYGMRYDLTVPLSRYYSAHSNDLPSPFKALQMGPVWRADRPQKGRYRQFWQADIDILGNSTNLAEIELITATTTVLGRLGFSGFRIHINDRRILKAMADYSGFPEEQFDDVVIIWDKQDKIGIDGVAEDLVANGFSQEATDKYVALFNGMQAAEDSLVYLEEKLAGVAPEGVFTNLHEIVDAVSETKAADFEMVFDPTIVRGMGYYTGPIFEIKMPQLGISAGGGGRYDQMIGRFTGTPTPACGLSIGFERIILIMMEQGFRIPDRPVKTAFLFEKNMPSERLIEVMKEAQARRAKGDQVLVVRMAKNKKHQKQVLTQEGYEKIEEFYTNPISR